MNKLKDLIQWTCLASLFAIPVAATWYTFEYEPAHRQFRKFTLQGGEVIYCRQMSGNAKYGVDFTSCKDGVNRYNVSGLVLEMKP